MEAEIKVEPSGLVGIVPIGSYVIDSLHRMGVHLEHDCGVPGECDVSCSVEIQKGRELLSLPTAAEKEQLTQARIDRGERLACQAKIEKEGELTIMVKEKPETEEEREAREHRERRKEFDELPLEKKVAHLLELEAVTFGETVSFIMNSPFKIFEKVMDVMAEFGLKMDQNAKDAKKPAEHRENGGSDSGKAESKKKEGKKEKNEEKSSPQ